MLVSLRFFEGFELAVEQFRRHEMIGARRDPLQVLAQRIARQTRLLCLDELFVSDIVDAMLLGALFEALLRSGVPDSEIAATIRETVQKKWLGHEINSARFVAPPRPMYAIGG